MAETKTMTAKDYAAELKSIVKLLDSQRAGGANETSVDLSLSEVVQERYGLSYDEYLDKMGIDTKRDTMQNIFTMPEQGYVWLVPEIIRSAISLGIKEAPFYPNIIASDQSIKGLTAIMPFVNPSDANPARVNEAETIPLGDVSFGQKSVTLFKIGRGFRLTDEVKNYVSLDVMSIFLRDFGVQLGYALDTLALDTVINGNKADGSESAPVIGVSTANTLAYKDLLRIWIRASRLGRSFKTMIGAEDVSLDLLDLPEFKIRQYGTTQATLNLKTPVPNSADYYIHPGVPENEVLMVDPRAALIKLTAQQLMLESERIASNQTNSIYATLTTGFSKMYRDAAILLDKSKTFDQNGFPAYMDIDPYIQATIEQ
jgi:hypothetical protein